MLPPLLTESGSSRPVQAKGKLTRQPAYSEIILLNELKGRHAVAEISDAGLLLQHPPQTFTIDRMFGHLASQSLSEPAGFQALVTGSSLTTCQPCQEAENCGRRFGLKLGKDRDQALDLDLVTRLFKHFPASGSKEIFTMLNMPLWQFPAGAADA